MDKQKLERLWRLDFSAGTDAFRDALLARCLSVLRSNDVPTPISDADLDMLAAAGSPEFFPMPIERNASFGDNGGEKPLA